MAAIVAVHSHLKYPLTVSIRRKDDGTLRQDTLRILPGRNEPDDGGVMFSWEKWAEAVKMDVVREHLERAELVEVKGGTK